MEVRIPLASVSSKRNQFYEAAAPSLPEVEDARKRLAGLKGK